MTPNTQNTPSHASGAAPSGGGVSCVIPVYNEAEAIASTLQRVNEVLAQSGEPYEIIVVDDGSTDGTREKGQAENADLPVRWLSHEVNRGYGAALKTGIRASSGDWVLIIDADGTYPPEEIPGLLADRDGFDMIVGQRSQTAATDPLTRRIGKGILVGLASFLAGRKIPDLNSGLRLMRRERIEQFWPLLPEGFSFTTTITLSLMCANYRVAYRPIEYRWRTGSSKIRPIHDMIGFTHLIVRTMTFFNPLKVYGLLSALLIAAAVLAVILSKLITGRVMDVTAVWLFVAGLQMLLLGVLADLMIKLSGLRERPPHRRP